MTTCLTCAGITERPVDVPRLVPLTRVHAQVLVSGVRGLGESVKTLVTEIKISMSKAEDFRYKEKVCWLTCTKCQLR